MRFIMEIDGARRQKGRTMEPRMTRRNERAKNHGKGVLLDDGADCDKFFVFGTVIPYAPGAVILDLEGERHLRIPTA